MVADKCVIFCLAAVVEIVWLTWPLPVGVCLWKGAGSVVIDSSEGGGWLLRNWILLKLSQR